MFELIQEMKFVKTWEKFCDNRLRNEVCRAVTPLGHVRTNICTGRSLYTLRGHNNLNLYVLLLGFKLSCGKSVKYRYIEFFAFDYDSLPISFQSGIAVSFSSS